MEKSYPCIEEVKNDSHAFYCTCCLKKQSCKHMGIGGVKGHFQGASHEKTSIGGMEMQNKIICLHSFPCQPHFL